MRDNTGSVSDVSDTVDLLRVFLHTWMNPKYFIQWRSAESQNRTAAQEQRPQHNTGHEILR